MEPCFEGLCGILNHRSTVLLTPLLSITSSGELHLVLIQLICFKFIYWTSSIKALFDKMPASEVRNTCIMHVGSYKDVQTFARIAYLWFIFLSSIIGKQSVQRVILTKQNANFLTGLLHIQVQYTPDAGHAFVVNSRLPLKKWLQIVMSVDDTTIYVTTRHFNGHVFEKEENAVHKE